MAQEPAAVDVRPASRALTLLVVALVLGGLVIAATYPLGVIFYVAHAAVGGLLAIRRPRAITGWLLIGVGWAFAVSSPSSLGDPAAVQAGTAPLHETVITWATAVSGFAALALYVVIMVTFPQSRLPQGRGRRWALALIGLALLGAVATAFGPTITVPEREGSPSVEIANPFALSKVPALAWLSPVTEIGLLLVIASLIVGAASMVIRMRRARGTERQQLRWLVAALVAFTVAFAAGVALTLVMGEFLPGVAYIPVLVAIFCIPVSIGFAVLRYRLYDIDTVINRTVLYGAVTLLVLGIFGVANLGLQELAQAWLGGPSVLLAGFLGIVVGMLYVPIRRAVRPVVDRFLPSRSLVTMLFTDIVGSTEQIVALGDDRWRILLGRYRAAVRQELSSYSGQEVDTAGDAFFATFQRPAQGVGCAVAIRSASARLGIQLRTGLHLGEVEMRGETLTGIEVHTAARVMAAAEPGEILLSAAVRDAIQNYQFATTDRGSRELKGVPGSWHLFGLDVQERTIASGRPS